MAKNYSTFPVKKGEFLEDTSGIYRYTGRKRNDNLYYVREYRISQNGNVYPVKGNRGLHSWTKEEIRDAKIK